MPTNHNLPHWRQLSDGWHCELVQGATRTACKRAIPARAPSSASSQPTVCNTCLTHYRQAKRGDGQPRPGARQVITTTTHHGGAPSGHATPPRRSRRTERLELEQPDQPLPSRGGRRPPPTLRSSRSAPLDRSASQPPTSSRPPLRSSRAEAPAPRPEQPPPVAAPAPAAAAEAPGASDDSAAIPPGYGRLRVGEMEVTAPMDEIRAMLPGQAAREPTDEDVVAWYNALPRHRRLELLRRAAWSQSTPGPLDDSVIALQDGLPLFLASGRALIGKALDRVVYVGPGCDLDWLQVEVATRLPPELVGGWLASLQADGDPTRALVWRDLPLPPPHDERTDHLEHLALAILDVDADGQIHVHRATSESPTGDGLLGWWVDLGGDELVEAEAVATAWCWLQGGPGALVAPGGAQ